MNLQDLLSAQMKKMYAPINPMNLADIVKAAYPQFYKEVFHPWQKVEVSYPLKRLDGYTDADRANELTGVHNSGWGMSAPGAAPIPPLYQMARQDEDEMEPDEAAIPPLYQD